MQKFFPYKKYIMKVLRLPKKKVTRNMLILSPLHIYIYVCVCVCVCFNSKKECKCIRALEYTGTTNPHLVLALYTAINLTLFSSGAGLG